MSKLNKAMHEFASLDDMAARDTWLNNINPVLKILVTFGYIIAVVSFKKYNLSGLLRMSVYLIVLFVIGEISFMESIKRLRFILPLVCIVGIFNPFYDTHIIMNIGNVGIRAGVISMITLMLKGVYSVLAAYILIASTSIEKIGHALRVLHVPRILVTMILLIYRYINVLAKETNKLMQAYSLRAPGQKGINIKAWGPLVGQLLLRSMDKAQDIYSSMCLRGYDAEFKGYTNRHAGGKNDRN